MHPIRLIAMDMDGTLLNPSQRISAENLTALKTAEACGIKLAVCSGRTAEDISYFLSDAGLDNCAVLGLNGACCLEKPHAPPYEQHTINPIAAHEVLCELLKEKVTFAAFQPTRVLVVQNDMHVPRMNWGTYVDRGLPNAYAYGEKSIIVSENEGICKFVYIDQPDCERIHRIKSHLNTIPHLMVTSSWNDNLEIMPEGVGKGLSLCRLADRLGISMDHTMAIGDYDNDLDMILRAGVGVAMGNASESVRQQADFITSSNAQNGVAVAIHHFALQDDQA